jgi:hypothetical protein
MSSRLLPEPEYCSTALPAITPERAAGLSAYEVVSRGQKIVPRFKFLERKKAWWKVEAVKQ